MSGHTKKIKAFTLSEMVVVLLITTLVVGIAFSVLRLVQQQMHDIGSSFDKNTKINLLRQSLWVDFNQFDTIWYDATKEELLFANTLKTITYQFHDQYVIKERDTFFIEILDRSHYFNGEDKLSGEIDALNFVVSKKDGGQRTFVFKRNAATSYVNQ